MSVSTNNVAGLVLAAGKGTRMKSAVPKVLHPVAGRPMVAWMLGALADAGIMKACVVLSEERTGFDEFLAAHPDLTVAAQKNQRGTGDAVAAASWSFAGVTPAPFAAGRAVQGRPIFCQYVLICAADTPAVRGAQLLAFVKDSVARQADVSVLGMRVPDPKGYGRMVTQGDGLVAIVEEKDTDEATRRIDVCNTGVIFARTDVLFRLLQGLSPENSQREYYLTDIVGLGHAQGLRVTAHVSDAWQDFAGVNDRLQLARMERWLVERKLHDLMRDGVTCHLPETLYVEADVTVGADTDLGPGSRLFGATTIGTGCRIGAGVTARSAVIGDRAVIGDGAVLSHCRIPPGEAVPPLSVRLA